MLIAVLLISRVLTADAQYTAFDVPGHDGTQSGYDFDGAGPFSGVWCPAGIATNGLQLTIDPLLNHFRVGPPSIVPWNTAQISSIPVDYGQPIQWLVTNFSGEITGLMTGAIVTIFLLYDTESEEMRITFDGLLIGSIFPTEETNGTSRLHRYGWITNDAPTNARVVGVSVCITNNISHFELTPISANTNTPPINVCGIVIDTNNTSAIDNDGDGQLDWQEAVAGTAPLDSDSFFRVTGFHRSEQDDSYVVSWPSVSNRSYRVESRTNLTEDANGQFITNVVAEPPANSMTTSVHVGGCEFITIQVTQ